IYSFFFSSRRRHTRFSRDWSSDVCSSDLRGAMEVVGVSIGGGKMEIVELNGFELKMTGNSPTLLVPHQDRYGAIAAVAGVLARQIGRASCRERVWSSVGGVALEREVVRRG